VRERERKKLGKGFITYFTILRNAWGKYRAKQGESRANGAESRMAGGESINGEDDGIK
jgi:hypothetical protein